jgi:hypothetical protein
MPYVQIVFVDLTCLSFTTWIVQAVAQQLKITL